MRQPIGRAAWRLALLAGLVLAGATAARAGTKSEMKTSKVAARAGQAGKVTKIVKTDQEWKQALSDEQYRILRRKGTERAFTGQYWNHHGHGVYRCAGCGLELFESDTKFDSGTGWPSFHAPFARAHVQQHSDLSLGMARTEVACARCGGHLGHVFDDGPRPTGLRYCINSAALSFEAKP